MKFLLTNYILYIYIYPVNVDKPKMTVKLKNGNQWQQWMIICSTQLEKREISSTA